jgi:uncharacterized protein YjbI with pentapeptide repeats
MAAPVLFRYSSRRSHLGLKAVQFIGRHLRSAASVIAPAVALSVVSGASAQNLADARSTIFDLEIGAPVSAQPTDFQEFACGTNGGPPSVPIAGFAQFAACPAEETGLHEVQFRYDDELHYIALARRDPLAAEFFGGTKIGNFPILASALIDDAGILRGIRAVTDDRVSDRTRRFAYSMPVFLRSIYGSAGWNCIDFPAAEGETPVGNSLIKQDCGKVTEDGFAIATQARLLRRPGQTLIDPANGQIRVGYYESTARMEMFRADASGNPIYSGDAAVAEAMSPDDAAIPTDPVEAFLAGATRDCPGCDLPGADLRRRDLAGADLAGANLSGARLHRALLGGANLDGADLTSANLNVADLKRASFVGADLTGALLFQADAAAADFSNAVLDRVMAENARFTSSVMVRVRWQNSFAYAANVAGADLSGAILVGTALVEADMQRAILTGADVTDGSFYRSRLRGADLSGVTALRTDFLEADLSEVSFVNADLTEARLLRARASGMDLTGAVLTGTVLPDGRIGP